MTATKIRKTPGICNGAACIGRTQIPVWKLIALYSNGCSEANLLSDYPVTKDDLKAARTYYAQNPVEIDEVMVAERTPSASRLKTRIFNARLHLERIVLQIINTFYFLWTRTDVLKKILSTSSML